MKKTLLAVLVGVMMVTPVAAQALSLGELVELLISLNIIPQEQADAARSVLEDESGTSNGSASKIACPNLSRTLYITMEGRDVGELQEFLTATGDYTYGSITNYFGPSTEAAVQRFQKRHGIASSGNADTTGYGVVGPKTRAKIRAVCGGSSTDPGYQPPPIEPIPTGKFRANPTWGKAPLTVSFKTWVSGFRPASEKYMIDYGDGARENVVNCYAPSDYCREPGINKHTYTSPGVYTAQLLHESDPCNGNPLCAAPVSLEVVGKLVITVKDGGSTVCTDEYSPVCARPPGCANSCPPGAECPAICQLKEPRTYSNKCEMYRDEAEFLHFGQCKDTGGDIPNNCRVWYDGCNTCSRAYSGGPLACTQRACIQNSGAYCKEYFSDTDNKPPTISGFSGPTTLEVDQLGEWKVTASDPENGPLSYSIRWGDEGLWTQAVNSVADAFGFSQTSTFTHSYRESGTYTVKVTVTDEQGEKAYASMTVNVFGGVSVDPVGVLFSAFPNTGFAPLSVSFSAQAFASSWVDPATGAAVAIEDQGYRYIDFGDGSEDRKLICSNPSGATCTVSVSHVYTEPGDYKATLFTAGYFGPHNDPEYGTRTDVAYADISISDDDLIACTADAFQCPDGSWVGRTAPSCAFICPDGTTHN